MSLTGPVLWHDIPSYIVVSLLTLVLIDPLLTRQGFWSSLRFWGGVLLVAGTSTFLAEMGKKYQIWQGHPGFPSGHTTITVALCWCVYLRRDKEVRKSWLWLLVPLAIAQGTRLILGHDHDLIEVCAGATLGTVFPWLGNALSSRRRMIN